MLSARRPAPTTLVPPRRDLELEPLVEVLEGKRLVHAHGYRSDEHHMLLELAKEFGFTVGTLQHALEAYKIAPEIREANAGVLRRKAEREAKEAKEKKDRELRVAANDAKEKAYTDKEKFAKQVSRLESDIKIEKDAISKLEEERKRLVEEQAFLRVYVKQAEDNVKSLSTVIDKIAAADAARAAAEAAAAKARRDRDNS